MLKILVVLLLCSSAGCSRFDQVLDALGEAGAPPARGERILSLDVNQAADGDFDRAFARAQEAGMEATTLSLHWDEIETAPGQYDPQPNWPAIANIYYPAFNTPISLALSPIDTNNERRPADLRGRPFDDPEVVHREQHIPRTAGSLRPTHRRPRR